MHSDHTPTADFLKRQAKRLKKLKDIPHYMALDEAAKVHGYANWRHFCHTDDRAIPSGLAGSRKLTSQSEFISQAMQARNHSEVLELAVLHHRNILLVGCSGSGKTTLANAIMHSYLELTPQDRVILIEDVREMQCLVQNQVSLLVTGKTTWTDLSRAALNLVPDRTVFGDIRNQDSAKALLDAWSCGPSGGLASIHANDAEAALWRLESLLGKSVHAPLIASSIHVSVWIDLEDRVPAGRKVRQIIGVTGYDAAKRSYTFQEL